MAKTYMGIEREKIPWRPNIDPEECIGCGACAEFCANNVFDMVGDIMTVKNPFNCVVGCDKCATECPTSALSFPSKQQLVKWIEEIRRASTVSK